MYKYKQIHSTKLERIVRGTDALRIMKLLSQSEPAEALEQPQAMAILTHEHERETTGYDDMDDISYDLDEHRRDYMIFLEPVQIPGRQGEYLNSGMVDVSLFRYREEKGGSWDSPRAQLTWHDSDEENFDRRGYSIGLVKVSLRPDCQVIPFNHSAIDDLKHLYDAGRSYD